MAKKKQNTSLIVGGLLLLVLLLGGAYYLFSGSDSSNFQGMARRDAAREAEPSNRCDQVIEWLARGALTDQVGYPFPEWVSDCSSQTPTQWACAETVGRHLSGAVPQNPAYRSDDFAQTCARDYPEIWALLPEVNPLCARYLNYATQGSLTRFAGSPLPTEVGQCANNYGIKWTCASLVGGYNANPVGLNPAYRTDQTALYCAETYPEIWAKIAAPSDECEGYIELMAEGTLTRTVGSPLPSEVSACSTTFGARWTCATIVGNYLNGQGQHPAYRTDDWATSCKANYPEFWTLLPPVDTSCETLTEQMANGTLTEYVEGPPLPGLVSQCANTDAERWTCAAIVGNYLSGGTDRNPATRTDRVARSCEVNHPDLWSLLQ